MTPQEDDEIQTQTFFNENFQNNPSNASNRIAILNTHSITETTITNAPISDDTTIITANGNKIAQNSENIVNLEVAPENLTDPSIRILTEDQFEVYSLLREWGMAETICDKFISKSFRLSTKNI